QLPASTASCASPDLIQGLTRTSIRKKSLDQAEGLPDQPGNDEILHNVGVNIACLHCIRAVAVMTRPKLRSASNVSRGRPMPCRSFETETRRPEVGDFWRCCSRGCSLSLCFVPTWPLRRSRSRSNLLRNM